MRDGSDVPVGAARHCRARAARAPRLAFPVRNRRSVFKITGRYNPLSSAQRHAVNAMPSTRRAQDDVNYRLIEHY
jgi:hypothetical protein